MSPPSDTRTAGSVGDRFPFDDCSERVESFAGHPIAVRGLAVVTSISSEDFAEHVQALIGLPMSRAWRGAGTAIFLEIGPLSGGAPGSPTGVGSLMLQWSWRVERPRSIWFGSFSSDRRISNQLPKLESLSVSTISVSGRLPEVELGLGGKVTLRSFSTVEGQPEWSLRLPSGRWLSSSQGRLVLEGEPSAG